MNLLHAIILGLVEGVTEYLPVSSTGHLILVSSLLGLNDPADKESIDAFTIVIQGGAILAVLGLYRNRVTQMVNGLLGRDRVGLRLAMNLVIAFLPAVVMGLLLAETISRHLFFPLPVLAALAGGGVIMIAVEKWQIGRFEHAKAASNAPYAFVSVEALSARAALTIGLLQCAAMWPGTSRSMVTILGGMLVGMKPRDAAEFSFLLGLPTLGAACLYSLAKQLTGDGATMFQTIGPAPLVTGLVVATLSAAVAVRWLVGFLNRHGLALFGWYRIALCVLLGLLILQGQVSISPEESAPTTPLLSSPPRR